MINKKFVTHNREPFFELAREIMAPEHKVLDIGAGDGSFSEYCKRKDIYQMEGNIESVEYLRKLFEKVSYGILPDLPFEDNFFDIIHMSHVIEHLQPDEVYRVLQEMDRCCKPGGAIIISAPLLWEGFYDDLSHVKPYSPTVLKKYMCSSDYGNMTRTPVSKKYSLERLEYRFLEKGRSFSIGKDDKYYIRLGYKIFLFFYRRGFKEYQRTGYTCVLRKLK